MRTLVLVGTIFCSSLMVGQDLASALTAKLANGMLHLRTPAPEVQLSFDSSGMPKHAYKHGIRSLDEVIQVKSVKLEESSLSLQAERLAMIWDPKSQTAQIGPTGMPVYVSIDLPNGKATSEAEFAPIYYKIFVSPEEISTNDCSGEERQQFQQYLSEIGKHRNRKEEQESSPQNTMLCFPGGSRYRRIAAGVKPPKPIKTPDPHYTNVARTKQTRGTNVFVIAIDDRGLVSDALMVRSLEPTLNYQSLQALRDWTFEPARMDGAPVPSSVMVEINYALW